MQAIEVTGQADCHGYITQQAAKGDFKGSRGDDFIPKRSTWLNQGRWEDDPRHAEQVPDLQTCQTIRSRMNVIDEPASFVKLRNMLAASYPMHVSSPRATSGPMLNH